MTATVLAKEMSQALSGFAARTVARLDGITDDEHLWEPAAACWSVRLVGATWRADLAPDGTQWTDDSPLTTIAWRLWHLGASPKPGWPPKVDTPRAFADAWFSAGVASPLAFGRAADAVAAFASHWQEVAAHVATYRDAELLEPIGPVGGPFGEATIHGLLFHVADELIHHSAEVALLRDLYREVVTGT